MNDPPTANASCEARGAGSAGSPGDTCSAQRLEQLFRSAHGELLGTLYYLVGNLEDAHDALQESFLKCWRHRHEVPEVGNLKAWVFRIALNTGRDVRKTAWNRRRRSLIADPASHPETAMGSIHQTDAAQRPDAQLIRDEELCRVREAVAHLRREEQEVFLLRQNGGLSYAEIADAMSLPLGTVKTRMRAAIGHLRCAVGESS
ncbi:RNA polymerase sigma factor [Roseimaritima sediminicola]|uniref:RNA polymerase sigma factor n=1 Tax=Roseimaritima sediminicola TaxID=2662066 RepID=UPI001298274C|nr:RNA polymerase sigma factor [Roseimaritima sediminicola]